jgi:hypothetical protein
MSVGKMFRVVVSFEKFQALQSTKNKLHHRVMYFLLTFGTSGNINCIARFFPNSKPGHGRNMNADVL